MMHLLCWAIVLLKSHLRDNHGELLLDGNSPQYQPITEVKKLGFPEHFLRERLRANTIPHIMIGNKYYINVPLFLRQMDRESVEHMDAYVRERLVENYYAEDNLTR